MSSINNSKGERVFKVSNVIGLIFVSFLCLYPMVYCLFASLSDTNLLLANKGLLIKPLGFNIQSYIAVFKNPSIISGFKNTFMILAVGVTINMVMTTIGAYFLARKNIYFKKVILVIIMITMYFSGGLIPTYLTVKALNLDNTIWALVLPGAISTYNMIVLRTGFASVPDSLCEAATIDGANDITILLKVYLPLTKATLAVILLYYTVGHWNSWFSAVIYLNDRAKYPIQLILKEILVNSDTTSMIGNSTMEDTQGVGLSIQYATIIVSTLPILIVYPFIQKYFVTGVMVGSVKE